MWVNKTALMLWAVTLTFALANGHRLFYSLFCLLTGLLLASFLWAWANVHWVRFHRHTRTRRSQVGKLAEERFTVRNTGPFPKLWLEVQDHSDLPGHRASRVIHSLRAGQEHSWVVKTTCRRRGRFTLGPVTLASGDPFGLFRLERRLDFTSHILVYPATVELPPFPLATGVLPGGEALRRRTHHVTTNVAGVRDYMPGDSFGRIHWPSTARTGRLISKEFELDPLSDVWLFLDMDLSVHAGYWPQEVGEEREPMVFRRGKPRLDIPPTSEEYGVVIAASLARQFISLGRAVGLVAYGQRHLVISPDRGSRQLLKILEALALARAKGRTPLRQVLTLEWRRLSGNVFPFIITPSASLDWVDTLEELRRRGTTAVVFLLDASSFGPAPRPDEVEARLKAAGVPTCVVHKGDDLTALRPR